KDQPVSPSDIFNESFQTIERSAFETDSLPNLQKRMGCHTQLGMMDPLDGNDFVIFKRNRFAGDSCNTDDTGSLQDRTAGMHIKPAEDISWKQGQFDLLDSIRPAAPRRIQRQKILVSLIIQ